MAAILNPKYNRVRFSPFVGILYTLYRLRKRDGIVFHDSAKAKLRLVGIRITASTNVETVVLLERKAQ